MLALYAFYGVSIGIRAAASAVSYFLSRKQRIAYFVNELNRLGMPRFTDCIRYDHAPALLLGVAQRKDITDELRDFLTRAAGEMAYLRTNHLGLAYVQNLSIINAALVEYQETLPERRFGNIEVSQERRLRSQAA